MHSKNQNENIGQATAAARPNGKRMKKKRVIQQTSFTCVDRSAYACCTVQHQRNGMQQIQMLFLAAFIIKDRLSRNLFSTIFLCMKIWPHYDVCAYNLCTNASLCCRISYRHRHIYLISLFHFIIGYAAYWRLAGKTLLRFGLLIKLFFWQFHFQCGALQINDLYKDTNTCTHLQYIQAQAQKDCPFGKSKRDLNHTEPLRL